MKFFKIGLWIALGMLIVAVVVEGVMWLALPSKKLPEFNVTLNNDVPPEYRLKTKAKMRFFDRFMRTGSIQNVAKREGTIRILCFGSGNTEHLLQGNEDIWWGQLEAKLERALPETRIEVGGIGLSRMGILQGARFCTDWAEYLDADVVIANFGLSDVINRGPEYRYSPNAFEKIPSYNPPSGFSEFLCSFSQVARQYRNSRRKRGWTDALTAMSKPNALFHAHEQVRRSYPDQLAGAMISRLADNDPLSEFLDGLDKFKAGADKADAAFIFIPEATIHSIETPEVGVQARLRMVAKGPVVNGKDTFVPPDFRWVASELRRYYGEAKKKCDASSITWIDLAAEFPRDLIHFVDDELMTDDGAAFMANEILPGVLEVVRARVSK